VPTVQTHDIATHYEDAGQGRPIVLLHAATLDHRSWDKQAAALQDRYRVLRYDLRGHGRTPAGRRRYHVDTLAEDLHAFITALRLDRPVVCGLSMGGMVAQTYAARHPDGLSGLILAGAPTPPLLSFRERMERAVMPRTVVPVARLVGYERLKKAIISMQSRAHGKAAMGTFKATDLPPMTTGDFVRAIKCMASFHKVPVDLAAIRVPTLVLCGENEPGFIHRHSKVLRASLATAEVAVIPGAGHASSLDQPDLFTRQLDRFLVALPR
jgi:3-oxoadipate enol-lactonase